MAEVCRLERGAATAGVPGSAAELLTYPNLVGLPPAPAEPVPTTPRRSSGLCVQADFALDAYRYWANAFGERPKFHREQWEYFYICQSLHERGLLGQGRRGLGFGVGRELLAALFARLGCRVLATDQAEPDAERAGWLDSGEHAASATDLNPHGLCPEDVFAANVACRVVDMNDIPEDLNGRFDFCWSCRCLKHLGSIEHGLRFIKNSMATLRPGGVAVHTTEFNLSSNEETHESRDLSLFRRRDIERVVQELEAMGCQVEPVDWGQGPAGWWTATSTCRPTARSPTCVSASCDTTAHR